MKFSSLSLKLFLSIAYLASNVLVQAENLLAADFSTVDDPQPAEGSNLRVLSFNILSEEWNDKLPVEGRKNTVASTILHFQPDVVGLQEVSSNWYAVLPELLAPQYEMVNPENSRGQTNYTGMIYNTEKVRLLDSGVSIFEAGNSTKLRVVNWGHYQKLDSGVKFLVLNTHWCIHKENRILESQEMAAVFKKLVKLYHCPTITVGDHNSDQESEEYKNYAALTGLNNARNSAKKVERGYRTYHAVGKKPRARAEDAIDQIFYTDDLTCLYYNVLIDPEILAASDHTPIYADFILK